MVDKTKLIQEAQKFLAKGQVDKAISSWEKIASAYPEGNTFNYLGDLYLKNGNNKQAASNFHKAAKIYVDEGFALKGLAIFKKVLNINPHDSSALIALGELNEEKNIAPDAIKYYLAAADVLSKEKRRNDLLDVYKRILRLAPTNMQLKSKVAELFSKEGFVKEAANEYVELGRLFEEKEDLENARKFYMKSVELAPSNKAAMISLASFSEKSGEIDKAIKYLDTAMERIGEDVDILLKKAHLFIEQGSMDKASECISKVVERDPANTDARKQLVELHLKTGEVEKAWREFGPVLDSLTAADRFDEAANVLEDFKEHNPIDSRRRLISVYKQAGNAELAFNELVTLSDLYEKEGKNAELLACLRDALEVQPENSEIRKRIEEVEATAPAAAPAAGRPSEDTAAAAPGWPSAEEGAGTTAPMAEAPPETEKTLDEALTEADIFLRYGLHADAKSLLESLKVKAPDNIDVHQKLKTLYLETNEKELALTECIVLSTLYQRADDEENYRANLKEAYELNPSDPRLEGKLDDIKVAAPDLESEEEQAGDFAGTGVDEGPEPLSVPDLVTLDAQEIEPELDNEVLEIFDEFKKGLEQEIDSSDSETHYNLGIAYKEMGLVDDAIKEFQVTSHDPNYFIQSATMLGICYVEKGLFSLAIDSFTGALMKMDQKDPSAGSMKYELAMAYEKNGNIKEALQLYTEVYAWNATFRDIGERITSLKKEEEIQSKQKEKKSRVSYL